MSVKVLDSRLARARAALLAGVVLATSAATARASFVYANFDDDTPNSGAGTLVRNGSTVNNIDYSSIGTATDTLRLTQTGNANQVGTAFHSLKQNVSGGFSTTFTVSMTNTAVGADGMAFVLHNAAAGSAATGASGASLGYGGITPSLVVELDAFYASPDAQTFSGGNGSQNGVAAGTQAQISVHANGDASDATGLVGTTAQVGVNTAVVGGGANQSATDVSSTLPFTMRIDYVANPGADNDQLRVYFESGTSIPVAATPKLNLTATAANNLEATFTGAQDAVGGAYLGFAAATGGSSQSHFVLNWQFTETAVPEPGSFAAGLLALVVAALDRRRLGR